jgi:PAS domain S-box-containing protein
MTCVAKPHLDSRDDAGRLGEVHDKVFRAEQVNLLYRSLPAALIANGLLGVLLVIVQWRAVNPMVSIVWLISLGVVLVLRGSLYVLRKRAKPIQANPALYWLHWFRLSTFATGVTWGMAGWLLYPAGELAHQAFLFLTLAGISAGAITSLAIDRVSTLGFVVPTLLPLTVGLVMENGAIPLIMTFMVVMFMVFLMISAVRMQKNHQENVLLRIKAVEQDAALRESESRFRDMADSAPALIWVADTGNKGVWYNHRWLEYTGRTMQQEIGLGWIENMHPEDRDRYRIFRQTAFDGRQRFEMEFRLRRADGAYGWIVDTGVPRFKENGNFEGYIGYCWDITARKHAEQALIGARDEADRANRAKSEFLSSMSHELRTPMNAILGFGQLMEYDATLSDEHQDNVREILKAGHHLLELINEVLDLAKVESGRIDLSLEPVEVYPIIEECLSLVGTLAGKRDIQLKHNGLEGAAVRADRTRLKQVLLNLLSNAIKYNREGGSVKLEVQPEGTDRLRIRVTDTGPGIPAERLEELFEPFNRLDAGATEIEGTGIGLTITRRIVELMGGAVDVESEPGVGSSFWIELPLESMPGSDHADAPPDRAASEPHAEAVQHTVLYIEDNPSNIKLVAQILGRRPHIHLITAHTPELGIELALARHPELILLDINMPGMDGYQVMKVLKANASLRVIPIVAVTANAMPRDIERGKTAGFADYLTKPLDVGRFQKIVDACLNRPSAQSPIQPEDVR